MDYPEHYPQMKPDIRSIVLTVESMSRDREHLTDDEIFFLQQVDGAGRCWTN
jgi:hypothetical protein